MKVEVPALAKEDKEQVAEEWQTVGLKDCYIPYNRQGEKPNGLYIKEKAVAHSTSMVGQKRSSRAISELSSEGVN